MSILLQFLQWIFGLIFRLPPAAALFIMRLAGEITYRAVRLSRIKKTVAGNIGLLFPQADALTLADKLLKNVSYAVFELLCVPFLKKSHLKIICRPIGLENIDLALAGRKGIIILMMHAGNYELLPIFLSGLGYKINSVLKAPPDPLFKILNRSRGYRGIKLINVLEVNMYRAALNALIENEIVILMVDTGALEGRHEGFPFLGKNLPAATGWLTLARRSGAAIIPTFSRREGKRVMLTFNDPLFVNKDNREETMKKVGRFYENLIKNHPEQWAIFLNEYEVKRMVEGE
ncbi:lysophospholipid acyltransferase family protein [Candidatus Saganbacteria bacterium]|uniref:Lysophospholipid acyltransferase family protein n=1 Tax=Candidatus Saganbacteria bacterium TaxID=2575572 RepID=A0A9D6UM55_UNCSA|nr:lysophospholipid acyltransferase family protein [Candidatus Saganbacteria bacterium]